MSMEGKDKRGTGAGQGRDTLPRLLVIDEVAEHLGAWRSATSDVWWPSAASRS